MENLKFKIKNSKIGIIGLVVMIGLVGSLGCAALSKNKQAENGLLEPAATLKFSDIPVPAGFKILTRDSYSFESAGIRVAMLAYEGKANIDQAVNFYKEQMPMYNWNLLNMIEYGSRLLNFERDKESCIINLDSRGNGVRITISVGPKSQTSKKSNRPVK